MCGRAACLINNARSQADNRGWGRSKVNRRRAGKNAYALPLIGADLLGGVRRAEAGNSVPVIYMTGNDSPAVHTAALQSGCLAYLTKPFSTRSLMQSLARASTALQ